MNLASTTSEERGVTAMAKAEISLEELGLDGGDGGKGALTAIPRTPPTYSNIELIAVGSIRIPPDRQRGDKINGRGEDEPIENLEDSIEAVGKLDTVQRILR